MIVLVDEKTDTVSFIGMSWEQVYFLDAILLYAQQVFEPEKLKQKAEDFLQACEAAAESVNK